MEKVTSRDELVEGKIYYCKEQYGAFYSYVRFLGWEGNQAWFEYTEDNFDEGISIGYRFYLAGGINEVKERIYLEI